MPVHPGVNNKKRDKLPTRRLLISRRNAVCGAWELLYRHFPSHFSLEGRTLDRTRQLQGETYGL